MLQSPGPISLFSHIIILLPENETTRPQPRMYPKIISLFNLLLAISLLFSIASALPLHKMDDISFRSEAQLIARSQPSTGRVHARSFAGDTKPTNTNFKRDPPTKARDEPKRSQVVKGRTPEMENPFRGKTKVYSGNYWRRKVYHL